MELEGDKRRLQTLKSLHEADLKNASLAAVESVFEWCNTYFDKGHNGFKHNPYWGWFGRLEKVLKHMNASFINGSACHLDLVQWATDPVWGDPKLRSAEKEVLLQADLPFLKRQLSQEHIGLLIINGSGVRQEYERRLGNNLTDVPISKQDALKVSGGRHHISFCRGRVASGQIVIGWNINLQSTPGVSDANVKAIGENVARLIAEIRRR